MSKILTIANLTHIWDTIKAKFATKEEVAGKVDKVEGKGLSANDYVDADKEKLAGIDSGAQVNVLETVKVNGTALTATDKGVDIDLSDYATNDDVDGKVDKVDGKGLSANDLTDELLAKLNNAASAEDVAEKVDKEDGKGLSANDLTDELLAKLNDAASSDDVEGKVDKVTGKGLSTNDLTDDLVEKINSAVTPDTLTQAVAEAGHIKFSFVDELPEEGQANIIYFTKLDDAEEEDAYEEFVFQNGAYEKIGATRVDLSNYWNKTNLELATDDDVDAALGLVIHGSNP